MKISDSNHNNKFILASDDIVKNFFENVENIISSTGQAAETTTQQKRICLLFRNGDLLIDRDSWWDPQISLYKEICAKKNIAIQRVYGVDIKIIRLLYEHKNATNTNLADAQQPMERMAANLLYDACELGASDIHIKVYYHEAEILFRHNGDIIRKKQIDANIAHTLLSAYYNAAEDADATYRIYDYQAARITNSSRLSLPSKLQSIRLQFNPLGSGGRYMVARLLYVESRWDKKIDLLAMGFLPIHIATLQEMRQLPEGINLIAGPTGSGKSTTLKIMLELLYQEREQRVNILSIEDPPEYEIEGVAQLPVTNVNDEEERTGAYRRAIIAALRSDPDIIMPGEARDAGVISLVFTAAMTGHQVWTSIHANNALGVFDRLRDQGVEDYKLTDHTLITGVISQRLIKTLCPHCKIALVDSTITTRNGVASNVIQEAFNDYLPQIYIANPQGCSQCSEGYNGRSIVLEIIRTNQELLQLIVNRQRKEAEQYWLEQLQGINIREHTWLKCLHGLIDPFDAWVKIGKLTDVRQDLLSQMVTS